VTVAVAAATAGVVLLGLDRPARRWVRSTPTRWRPDRR
jgi:hypothetical protein